MLARTDARVHDHVALDEIELYGELMIAASKSEGPLTVAEIDAILGVVAQHSGDAIARAHRRHDRTRAARVRKA
ncbi:MAG TPA: hypothetical protein VKG85_02160 [Actinomycetes bacterium]|nr:hypothetical protein [Actinomycetes bacterium]